MAELKPCPYCGGTTISATYIAPFYNDWFKIMCLDCRAEVIRSTKEDAVNAWNRGVNDG